MSDKEPVTLINVFEIEEGKLDAALAMWTASRDLLQQQPGYISTALHQALMPDARFQLINIAQWESAEAFQNAMQTLRAERGERNMIEGVKGNPALYHVIKRDD